MTGDEPPSGERPRWSFTWLIRLQRIGRNRRERDFDTENDREDRQSRLIITIVLGAIALIEVGVAVWLGVLPR